MANIGFLHETGAKHYSLEAITMLTAMLRRLPSKLAAQAMQAFFFGDGTTCHAADLHMEHTIKTIKSMLKRLGKAPGDIESLTKCV